MLDRASLDSVVSAPHPHADFWSFSDVHELLVFTCLSLFYVHRPACCIRITASLIILISSLSLLPFIVVLLDTTKESSLDWTRYPYGPQSRTPGVSIIWSTPSHFVSFSSPLPENPSSFESFHAWSCERFLPSFHGHSRPCHLFFSYLSCSRRDIQSLFYRPCVMTTFKPHFPWFTASDQME